MPEMTPNGVPVFNKPEKMPEIMPIERIDDFEMRLKRQDAFWSREIIDRPVVHILLNSPNPEYPPPTEKTFASQRDRWMDSEYCAKQQLHKVMNTQYLGDALPMAWPNLGPEVFSAFFGTELDYSETTSWSIPNLLDWSEAGKIKFSADNFYWKKINEMTDCLLQIGKGKFYTGYTDIHPGGDALVAFRDPLNLNMDMIENTDALKSLLAYVDDVFADVFNYYSDKLQSASQAICTWPSIVSSKRYHVPSNDFSCMISNEMFRDVFLGGLARECDDTEASIYHLDGPGALQHLDSLLEIDSLDAIQWIYGTGKGRATDWLHIYKRCQDAGKGIQVYPECNEVDALIENLKPEGVWVMLVGVNTVGEAEEAIRKIEKWT
ncbi:MAG: hypothetical protein JW808_09800 [Victivallales bacterium]|nr:hypothetical protein [Victivallales bacterium]